MRHPEVISSPTYYKQAKSGLLIHVYEHLVATQLDGYMRRRGQLFVVDYDMWGKTYGRTCFLESNFQTKQASKIFKRALKQVSSMIFTPEMLEFAAQSCACEYSRPLMKLEDSLLREVNELNKTPWKSMKDFTYDRAHIDTSVSTVFEQSNICYGRHTPSSFTEVIVRYTVPADLYVKDPALKALAILIVQAIALNQNGFFTEKVHYYDVGDEWHEGASDVGYRTYMRFPKKSAQTLEYLEQGYADNLQHILQAGFKDKLVKLVKERYENEMLHYFGMEVLNNITGGLIVGPKGWQDIATKTNVETILRNLEVKFI